MVLGCQSSSQWAVSVQRGARAMYPATKGHLDFPHLFRLCQGAIGSVISFSLQLKMHSMGFEPTSTNTVQLECTPLDRSGTNASLHRHTWRSLWTDTFNTSHTPFYTLNIPPRLSKSLSYITIRGVCMQIFSGVLSFFLTVASYSTLAWPCRMFCLTATIDIVCDNACIPFFMLYTRQDHHIHRH